MSGTRTELACLRSALADLTGMTVTARIDTSSTDRLDKWGSDHLATLPPEWAEQLRKEWIA